VEECHSVATILPSGIAAQWLHAKLTATLTAMLTAAPLHLQESKNNYSKQLLKTAVPQQQQQAEQ
jgi:hypothetical protein